MPATEYNILVEKGACFDLPLTLTDSDDQPYDLSNYTIRGQIRRVIDEVIQAEFEYSVLNIEDSSVSLSLSREDTLAMHVCPSRYDVFLIPESGCSEKILFGNVEIKGNVTA
jgi:hypothetical protein